MTVQIADDLSYATGTNNVGVMISARHSCMEIRGIKKFGAFTHTNVMLGELRNNPSLKQEFMSAVEQHPSI
jgi:GTP cyclohydrolase I